MKRAILIAMVLASAAAAALAQPRQSQALDTAAVLPLDTAVAAGVLPNGLQYFVRANHKPEHRAELLLAVNAGSVLEQDNERGLSHFLEHMAFNGTKNFPHQALVDYIESIGMRFGADLNAGTGFDHTIYMLTVPTDSAPQFRQALQVLEDWAHQISFDDGEIDKERGVIMEEWRMGRGARRRIWDQQAQMLLAGSRYDGRNPIGDTAVILHFPHQLIKDYYKRWYRPDLMAVIAVGDFDRDAVVRQIKERFGAIPKAAKPAPRPVYPVPAQAEPRYSVVTDPEATGTMVSIEFLRKPDTITTVGGARRELAAQLFAVMLNQRLDELAKLPRPPFIEAEGSKDKLVATADEYSLGASVADTGVTAGLAALLTEARRVQLHGFVPSELARARAELLRKAEKEYQERDKTESRSFAWRYASHYLDGHAYLSPAADYQLTRALLPGISLAEVNALAKELITPQNRVYMASGPQRAGLQLPTEAGLSLTAARIEGEPVAPYVDKVAAQDLMPVKPKPGKVAKQKDYPELGLHEWTLANGVRVLLKPTDFKNDEILMRAFSLGGTSLADSAGFPSAQFAASIVEQSGLGAFDQTQLEKFLADKIVSVTPAIGRFDQGLTASASPADVATMLQLAHLYLTAPRSDSAAFRSFINRTAANLRNRNARPETALMDSLQLVLGRHSFRAQPASEQLLARVRLDDALGFYRRCFGKGDLTFILVGSFNPDSIRPLVETYLGSLPAAKLKSTWKDDGLRYPAGVSEVSIAKGIEPKSTVRMAFPAAFAWSQRDRLAANAVADYLDIRLREVVREDKSGTYSIWAFAQPSAEPEPQCLMHIAFGCAPERAGELTAAVFGVIDSLRLNGIPGGDLAKVKEIDLKEWETNSKQNSYWLGTLYQYARYQEDFGKILGYPALVNALTAEDVRQAARKYIDPKRYVKVTLLPAPAAAVPQKQGKDK
ncbi:MAG TPA: insulinase family protein [Candidatus Edwardsbacteria bacterium]|nr:insulinase family protein [Candidatus Edwardsbacteria bacterium]